MPRTLIHIFSKIVMKWCMVLSWSRLWVVSLFQIGVQLDDFRVWKGLNLTIGASGGTIFSLFGVFSNNILIWFLTNFLMRRSEDIFPLPIYDYKYVLYFSWKLYATHFCVLTLILGFELSILALQYLYQLQWRSYGFPYPAPATLIFFFSVCILQTQKLFFLRLIYEKRK